MTFKKISVLILTIILCMTAVQVCATSDVEDCIEMVSALGIMRGYEDGEFRPENLLTRSEAVVTISGMIGLIPEEKENNFYDVPQEHWAKGYVEAAGKARIVSGVEPGVFQPESNVTKYQAAVMLVNVMGYGEVIELDEFGNKNYISAIKETHLFDGIVGDMHTPITRKDFAKMICNSLEEKMLDVISYGEETVVKKKSDTTVMRAFFDLQKTSGQITANEKTGLTGGEITAEGYVLIEDALYNVGGTSVAEQIGRYVTAYYREERTGEKTIVYYRLEDRKSLLVHTDDILTYKDYVFSYQTDASSDTKSVRISPVADVLFNGSYKISVLEDFKPADGTVELYDSDADGIYDVVYVKSYTLYLVDKIDYEKRRITDRYHKVMLLLDKAEKLDIYLDGKRIDFEDLQEGDVLLVAADIVSYDKEYPLVDLSAKRYEILVSRDRLEGTVTKTFTDYITINDEKYEYSDGMRYAIGKGETLALKPASEAIFLLDCFGKIVGTQNRSLLPSGGAYAYIVDCVKEEQRIGDGRLALKVYDFELRDTKIMYGTPRMIIDGEQKKTATAQYDAMLRQYNGAYTSEFAPRLVVYKTNEEGLVSEIDTDYLSSDENAEETLCYDENQQTDMYAAKVFGGNIAIGEDTIILAIPRLRATSYPAQNFTGSARTFIGNKTLPEYLYFRNSYAVNSTKYTVESYNIKENGEAPIILYYYYPILKAGVISSESASNMMVQDVVQILLNGKHIYEVRGYDGAKYITLFISPEDSAVVDIGINDDYTAVSSEISVEDLKRGDIVRYSDLRKNSNITLRIERVVNTEDEFVPNIKHYAQQNSNSTLTRSDYFNAFNVSCGKVVSCENGIVKVDFTTETKIFNLNNVPLCTYDEDREVLEETDMYEILPETEIVLVMTDGSVKNCYIYR